VRKVTVLKGDVAKSSLEEAIEDGGLEWTALAPVEFMSNALEWAESVRTEGVVRDGFADSRSAMVHDADIAAVAAVALTGDGHAGREYWLTGPEALTPAEKVRTIAEVLGRDVRFVELSKDEIVARWRASGYDDESVEFFLAMRTAPPEAGRTVLPTVREVTGKPARTFAQWVGENAAGYGARGAGGPPPVGPPAAQPAVIGRAGPDRATGAGGRSGQLDRRRHGEVLRNGTRPETSRTAHGYYLTDHSRPTRINSDLRRVPSLSLIASRWRFTVRTAMPSAWAISRLSYPTVTQCRTSRSRVVSAGGPGLATGFALGRGSDSGGSTTTRAPGQSRLSWRTRATSSTSP
jgi:hypothetical protein